MPPMVAPSANGGSSGIICRFSASMRDSAQYVTPASTLMVRSCGSYCSTRVRFFVEIEMSDGSTGPAILRLVDFPHRLMVCFPAAAFARESANASGVCGVSTSHYSITAEGRQAMTDYPLLNAIIFAGLGIVIFVLSFMIIDKFTPFHLWTEIVKEKNVALAILLGAMSIGM